MFEDTNTIETAILESVGTTRKANVKAKPVSAKLKAQMVKANGAAGDLTQAFLVSGNGAAMMRYYLGNVGPGWQHIVACWAELHSELDECEIEQEDTIKKSIANYRTTLRTASLELFEDALTIKNDEIVKAASRNKKSTSDPLVEFVKAHKNDLTDAQKASAIEAIKALMEA